MCEFWSNLLSQFQISTLESHAPEVLTERELRNFELQAGMLPLQYKNFCKTFGSSLIPASGMQLFCPNADLSEMHLYPFRLELEEDFLPTHDLSQLEESLKSLINILMAGTPLVFGTDPSARIYLFDLESYLELDKSCDIWCVSLDSFDDGSILMGRDFRDFFTTYFLGLYGSPRESRELIEPISPEDYNLVRFNSQEVLRDAKNY
ncbi:hypothetical protein ACQ4N7_15185 [Nodosilinea sp. AN01ver1]|uniref:hypothetical protein n=1 Tax=Nodosilinea sp. AN01ver1 TaxID=3423362 RepID=UPI003D318366